MAKKAAKKPAIASKSAVGSAMPIPATAAPTPLAPPPPPSFASMYPGVPPEGASADPFVVPPALAQRIGQIESELKMPVWLLLQDRHDGTGGDGDSFNSIGDAVSTSFFKARHGSLIKGQKIALLIDSNGGQARPAYELAMLLRRHCGGFVALIPRHAKSAATLLALGADTIIMNAHAELGPLDVQIWDPDREEQMSGLDEVQSLERLHAFAMDATDRMMFMLIDRTKKKVNTLTPMITDFVTKLTKPMFENIDVVRYTQMSRLLKVAEEYGKRLLERVYGEDIAKKIANKLVTIYPEHGFPIYPDDACNLGLRVDEAPAPIRGVMEDLTRYLPGRNFIGRMMTGVTRP